GGDYHWGTVSNSPIGAGAFNEYLQSLNNGSSYISQGNGTGINFRFTINGEPVGGVSVPDGGSTAMLLGIGLLAFVFASRRLRQAALAARLACARR
ncbi:MAG TPA: VPDSG-CTERM sorting domain-containing protein, partial [Terrimicrobiaceae bacterium]